MRLICKKGVSKKETGRKMHRLKRKTRMNAPKIANPTSDALLTPAPLMIKAARAINGAPKRTIHAMAAIKPMSRERASNRQKIPQPSAKILSQVISSSPVSASVMTRMMPICPIGERISMSKKMLKPKSAMAIPTTGSEAHRSKRAMAIWEAALLSETLMLNV
jgi:hypothetical protein